MRKAKHPRRFDRDTTPDELTRGPLRASFVPAAELGRVRGRKRARGDRKECEQRGGIGARTSQAGSDESPCIWLRAVAPHEGLEPER
jgi:hypothetical protein